MFLYFYCTIFYVGIQGVSVFFQFVIFKILAVILWILSDLILFTHLNNEIITNFSNKGYKSNILK